MKIISCASYYGTGSSAITDFLSEFDNICSMTNYEFRFVQDPDGISDLEYNLVENHNRHNSGHALKRFKKLVDFNAGTFFNHRYESFFDGQYKKLSYEYIDALTDFTFKGYWFYDLYDRGRVFYYSKLLPSKVLRKLKMMDPESSTLNELPNEITYCSKPTEEKFLNCTREYIDKLLGVANKKNMPMVMVDQIVPPSNLNRYLRYFNDIQVVVVERDPRDIYLLAKYKWKDRVIPVDSPEVFCKWYEYTRSHRKTEHYNPEKVILVQFEDLIYHYDDTTKRIIDWLGLDESQHTRKFAGLNPANSIKNTQLWKQHPEYLKEADYIKEYLSEYIYNFQEGV